MRPRVENRCPLSHDPWTQYHNQRSDIKKKKKSVHYGIVLKYRRHPSQISTKCLWFAFSNKCFMFWYFLLYTLLLLMWYGYKDSHSPKNPSLLPSLYSFLLIYSWTMSPITQTFLRFSISVLNVKVSMFQIKRKFLFCPQCSFYIGPSSSLISSSEWLFSISADMSMIFQQSPAWLGYVPGSQFPVHSKSPAQSKLYS